MSVNKANKLEKQVNRRIISLCCLLVIVSLALLLATGCASNANRIDTNKELSLDENKISFLSFRDLKQTYPDYSLKYQHWRFFDGLTVNESVGENNRPYLWYSTSVYSENIGDERSLFDKYIFHAERRSFTMSIVSYGFEGDIGDITYEFSPFEWEWQYLGCKSVKIYNNGELVAKLYCRTSLNLNDEFFFELLDKALLRVSVENVSLDTLPLTGNIPELDYSEHSIPNIEKADMNILGVGDIRDWSGCKELIRYDTQIKEGYIYEFWHGYYTGSELNTELTFIPSNSEYPVDVECIFYEFRGDIEDLSLSFSEASSSIEYDNVVNMYYLNSLVGQLFYNENEIMTQEYVTEFITENLINLNVCK